MKIPIDEIKVRGGRRELNIDHAHELSESIRELGLLNSITVDKEHFLIAGLHRLEAVKLLGWTMIECNECSLEGLQAELAEIDENFVRNDLSALEYGDMLLRRKEVYEMLHPETKAGVAQATGMNRIVGNNVDCKMQTTSKSFINDTADKLGVHPCTVARQIQAAKNLTPEAKEIVKDTKISKKSALQLSRLEPEQQQEAAALLAAKEIKSVEEYKATKAPLVPKYKPPIEVEPEDEPEADISSLPVNSFTNFKYSVADLKNPDKDCSCTPDMFLAEFAASMQKLGREIEWYRTPRYTEVFPHLSAEQLSSLQQLAGRVPSMVAEFINQIERMQAS